jgi:hypothetical protein
MPDIPEILATEFSESFAQFMRNRMVASFFKYGPAKAAYPGKVDALESLRLRLKRYEETGNAEWLVDAANFAMLEFMLPRHPRAHFRATDSGESPGRVAAGSNADWPTQKANADLPAREPGR